MNGCCAPNDHDPTPGEERIGAIALTVILTVSAATLGALAFLLLA